MARSIYINLNANSLRSASVVSPTDRRPSRFSQFVAGDVIDLNLYVVNSSGLQNIQDYASVRVGIGGSDSRPNAGTYTIASTNTLNYNHSAQELESIIDSTVADAEVTELAPFVFKIQFTANGTQSIPDVDGRLLNPRSTVDVARMITGDSSTPETWLWRIYRNPLAFTSTFTNIANNGINGTLDLNTSGIYDLIGQAQAETTFFEVEATSSSGNITTILQAPVTILGEVIGQSFNGTVPQPTGLPAQASAFLQSFPNPDFAGDVGVNGKLTVRGQIESTNGDIKASGCDFTSGTIGGVIFGGSTDVDQGSFKAPDIIANEISCQGSTTNTAQPLRFFSNNHRFGDYDQAPDDLLVIKKIDGYTGARVGINKNPSASNAVALHVVAGENASTSAKDLGLKVVGGSFFEDFIRIGHYTDQTRDDISSPKNGAVIYNSQHNEFQGYVGGGTGWQKFNMGEVST